MPKLKIKIHAEWEHEYDDQELVDLIDQDSDEGGDPTEKQLAEALEQYKENLQDEIMNDLYSYISTDLEVEISDALP